MYPLQGMSKPNSGPPSRYEHLFDESASDEEIIKIKEIRDKTRYLVHSLWEAARDSDALEEHLLPIKQWLLTLI
jgi:hypothetical protein